MASYEEVSDFTAKQLMDMCRELGAPAGAAAKDVLVERIIKARLRPVKHEKSSGAGPKTTIFDKAKGHIEKHAFGKQGNESSSNVSGADVMLVDPPHVHASLLLHPRCLQLACRKRLRSEKHD